MIVTAALAWWDERPEDLIRCVEGMATIADRVIAVDGAYSRYPGATVSSDPEQAEAILTAAARVGLDAGIVTSTRLWRGQVEKRQAMMRRAIEGSDWVAVVDADWIISGDREAARAELEATPFDVVSVPFYTPPGDGGPASGWHRRLEGLTDTVAHLYRALPGFRVDGHHWRYSARKDGKRVWLWGGDATRPILEQHRIEAPYRIDHLCLQRSVDQVRAGRAFLNDRTRVLNWTGQEDDRPDLPRPVFDFETDPYP